jgi:hypothetical protein
VICLALLVFCLTERHIRAQIAPQTTIPGLYAGRPAPLQQHLLQLLGVDPLKPP